MNTAEILRAAAARVREGWTQKLGRSRGNVCAYGAIADAVSGNRFSTCESEKIYDFMAAHEDAMRPALPALLRAIGQPSRGWWSAVYHWNDAPGQTAENVALGLEYAALLWEQEQAAPSTPTETPEVAHG